LLAVLFSVVKAFPGQNNQYPLKSPLVQIAVQEASTLNDSSRREGDGGDEYEKRPDQSKMFDDPANGWPPSDFVDSNAQFQPDFVDSNAQFQPQQTPRKREVKQRIDRPSTPSMGRQIGGQAEKNADAPTQQWATSDFDEWDDAFSDMPKDETPSNSNVTIDVKPLPKLRLDLMPAPREEDEDDISTI